MVLHPDIPPKKSGKRGLVRASYSLFGVILGGVFS
jgi:hypothetical protein